LRLARVWATAGRPYRYFYASETFC
jgi:hypothetical protein